MYFLASACDYRIRKAPRQNYMPCIGHHISVLVNCVRTCARTHLLSAAVILLTGVDTAHS